jgi:hypothetical protein
LEWLGTGAGPEEHAMMGDAVKWLERDLREVVRSYFQPLRSIGRDIRDALTKDDPTPAAAQVLYREIPDDGKPAQRCVSRDEDPFLYSPAADSGLLCRNRRNSRCLLRSVIEFNPRHNAGNLRIAI